MSTPSTNSKGQRGPKNSWFTTSRFNVLYSYSGASPSNCVVDLDSIDHYHGSRYRSHSSGDQKDRHPEKNFYDATAWGGFHFVSASRMWGHPTWFGLPVFLWSLLD
jgi:hypothetical protein